MTQAVSTSLSFLLKNAGYKSIIASGPKEAIDILHGHQMELAILDMNFTVETTGEEGLKI